MVKKMTVRCDALQAWNSGAELIARRQARSGNQPENARNHIRDPSEMIWQTFGRRFTFVHRHNEQMCFYRFDEVGRRESRITANAARFDRNVGVARGQYKFFHS